MAGTLMVSRAKHLFGNIKQRLEYLGYTQVVVTGEEKDSLNMLIDELQPRVVLIGSGFYHAGTPYMTGQLLNRFPKLNIAAVSVYDYPLNLAPWFIWHGAKSYLNLWEGLDEFEGGLREVRDGGAYISPEVRKRLDLFPEWPDTKDNATKRQMEIVTLMCAGFPPERIGETLHISRKTVNRHIENLYETFHVSNREEMVAMAWELDLVTKDDVRFYAPERKKFQPPEWAAAKNKMKRIQ